MMEYYEAFKEGLKLVPSRLFRFIKKLYGAGFLYSIGLVIPVIISLVGMFLVKVVSQNVEAASLTMKILFTIGQIVPLSISLHVSENELINTDENSAELCYAICVSFIVYIWNNF